MWHLHDFRNITAGCICNHGCVLYGFEERKCLLGMGVVIVVWEGRNGMGKREDDDDEVTCLRKWEEGLCCYGMEESGFILRI